MLLQDGPIGYSSLLNINLRGPQKISGKFEAEKKIFLLQIPTTFSLLFSP